MFKNTKEYLTGKTSLQIDQSGAPSERELQVATAILLLEMAHADQTFASEEFSSIVSTMQVHFELAEDEVGDLLEIAEFLRKEPGTADKFVREINNHYDEAQRQHVLALLWKVIEADGVTDRFEAVFIAEVRSRLNLSLEQAVTARQLVEKGEV